MWCIMYFVVCSFMRECFFLFYVEVNFLPANSRAESTAHYSGTSNCVHLCTIATSRIATSEESPSKNLWSNSLKNPHTTSTSNQRPNGHFQQSQSLILPLNGQKYFFPQENDEQVKQKSFVLKINPYYQSFFCLLDHLFSMQLNFFNCHSHIFR